MSDEGQAFPFDHQLPAERQPLSCYPRAWLRHRMIMHATLAIYPFEPRCYLKHTLPDHFQVASTILTLSSLYL